LAEISLFFQKIVNKIFNAIAIIFRGRTNAVRKLARELETGSG
jgi:hypothetical protein